MQSLQLEDNRWELYKVLGDRLRLRVLACGATEELAIGELAEALQESQPNISRHVTVLRGLGLLHDRRQGTRVLVRVPDELREDPVVADALRAGASLLDADDTRARIAQLVQRRDQPARELFARAADPDSESIRGGFAQELPAFLAAASLLLPRRELAIDAGAGDGRLLDALAPMFEQVIAVDREPMQLERAAARVAIRGYPNVRLIQADLHDRAGVLAVQAAGTADVVFASRILHHAPRPLETLSHLASLLRPGGTLIVLDYAPHDDESMRERQADLWLGFDPAELCTLARSAGLVGARVQSLPGAFCGAGPDRHLTWQVMSAQRPPERSAGTVLHADRKVPENIR